MNTRDISEAKDPDLRASVVAMQRAAKLARTIAMQTDTGIVIVEKYPSEPAHLDCRPCRSDSDRV